jgi:Fur family transcriptional regulator, zinc uptake regulator
MAAEFSRRTNRLLDQAGEVCQRRGAALTELRRDVLGLILDAASPSGAYDLLDRLRRTRRRARAADCVSHTRFPTRPGSDP